MRWIAKREAESLVKREEKERRRQDYLNSPDGRIVQAQEEIALKRRRDIESGMSHAEIDERNELRLSDQKGGKSSLREVYSADPKVSHKRQALR